MAKIGQDVISEKPKRQIPSWVLAQIKEKPFRMEYTEPGKVYVYSPYNFDFLQELKEKIPATDRQWNPKDKRWEVDVKHDSTLKELGEKYYGMSVNEFLEKVYKQGKIIDSTKGYNAYEIDRTPQLEAFAKTYGESTDKFYIPPGSAYGGVHGEDFIVVYVANPGYYYDRNPSSFEERYVLKKGLRFPFLPEAFRPLRYTSFFDKFQDVRWEDIVKLSDEKIVEIIKEVNSANNLYNRKFAGEYYLPDEVQSFIKQLDLSDPKAIGAALKAYLNIVV